MGVLQLVWQLWDLTLAGTWESSHEAAPGTRNPAHVARPLGAQLLEQPHVTRAAHHEVRRSEDSAHCGRRHGQCTRPRSRDHVHHRRPQVSVPCPTSKTHLWTVLSSTGGGGLVQLDECLHVVSTGLARIRRPPWSSRTLLRVTWQPALSPSPQVWFASSVCHVWGSVCSLVGCPAARRQAFCPQ